MNKYNNLFECFFLFPVHQCLFCPQVFKSAATKDDHILEHFAQEVCTDCNQNLIRIGSNLYTLHNAVTCIKRDEIAEVKLEEAILPYTLSTEVLCENRYDESISDITPIASGFEEILIKLESDEEQEQPGQSEQPEYIVMDLIELPEVNKNETDLKQPNEPQEIVVQQQTLPEPEIQTSEATQNDNNTIQKPLLCDVCGQSFDCELFLESHKKLKHSTNDQKPTPTIPERALAPSQNGDSPIKKVRRKNRRFKHRSSSTLHKKKGAESSTETKQNVISANKRLFCDVCGQPFDCELFLESHKKLKHGESSTFKKPAIPEGSLDSNGDSTIQTIYCDLCGQAFDCQLFLDSHKKLKHTTPDVNALKMPRPAGKCNVNGAIKRMKMEGKPVKKYECMICNKMYATDWSLRTHIETIHDPTARKFQCSLCDQAFFRECALQSHHEQVHLNLKNFVCSICEVALKSKAALDRHMYQHTGKPIKCTWNGCEKTFSCSSNRDEHFRCHTGEKPFHCTIGSCDKRFTFAADFRKHKYVVHNVFTKKFPCEICAEVFPQNAMLKKHIQNIHDAEA